MNVWLIGIIVNKCHSVVNKKRNIMYKAKNMYIELVYF